MRAWISTILLSFLAANVQAQVLFIVSSGENMFSKDNAIENGMEILGAEIIKTGLEKNYRKVFVHTGLSGNSIESDLRAMTRELKADEKIDVFSMEHGPVHTPFVKLPIQEALGILPQGSVRNVYNTACSEWGRVEKFWNLRALATPDRDSQDDYSELKPDFFALHANDNHTGYFSLGLLIKEIRKDGNWPRAITSAFKEYDELATDVFKDIADANSDGTLADVLGEEMIPKLSKAMSAALQSRIVLSSKTSIPGIDSWARIQPAHDYQSVMLAPTPEQEKQWAQWCPAGYEQDMSCNFVGKQRGGLRRASVKVFKHLEEVFTSISDGNGCVSPSFINAGLKRALNTDQLALQRLCMNKLKNGYRLSWEWKNRFDLEGVESMENVSKLRLLKRGYLDVLDEKDLKVRLAGVSIIVKNEVLNKVRSLGVDPVGITIKDSGETQAHVQVAGLVPVRVGSSSIQNLSVPEFVKLFGIKVWSARQ
jgi:hypothetical protein